MTDDYPYNPVCPHGNIGCCDECASEECRECDTRICEVIGECDRGW